MAPKPAARAATPATVLRICPVSSGLALTQALTRLATLLKLSISSRTVGLSDSPRVEVRLKARFLAISMREESSSARMSASFCMEPWPAVSLTSSSWRRYSPMFWASLAASSPNSLPKSWVVTLSCSALGSLLMASSTVCRVPVAFLAMPLCRASASSPMALRPSWKRLGCWVAMASSRTMALVAVPATSAVAPRVRKVEPSAAASL